MAPKQLINMLEKYELLDSNKLKMKTLHFYELRLQELEAWQGKGTGVSKYMRTSQLNLEMQLVRVQSKQF